MTGILGIMSASEPLLSMSYRAQAKSVNSNITIPATAQTGDFAVLFDWSVVASGSPASVVPSGWNAVSNVVSTLYRAIISWRIIQSGDPGLTITGMTLAAEGLKQMIVWQGNLPVTSVVASTFEGEIGAGINPAAQTIAAFGQVAPVLSVAHSVNSDSSTATFNVGTFTQTVSSTNTRQLVGYRLMNNAPLTSSVDKPADHSTKGNCLQSGYFVLS
ncbi:hypothetical protein [Porticoccus sp.]